MSAVEGTDTAPPLEGARNQSMRTDAGTVMVSGCWVVSDGPYCLSEIKYKFYNFEDGDKDVKWSSKWGTVG